MGGLWDGDGDRDVDGEEYSWYGMGRWIACGVVNTICEFKDGNCYSRLTT